ncbi:hypothetical protein DPMN_079330 [Dreissena polymorpha]|uniref:Uncharacterized protein n=1 Tax=Dreissena polymorpha TaxID=45954 RepID=A0A9D3YSZ1_DREPO|nr:hypothetical protein DPMN_079330 [Dreissena polymorpha]
MGIKKDASRLGRHPFIQNDNAVYHLELPMEEEESSQITPGAEIWLQLEGLAGRPIRVEETFSDICHRTGTT